MDLSHIQAIIFDAEGVVVNTEKLWDQSQELLLGKRGLTYHRDYLKPRMAGQTLLEGAQLMVRYYGLNEDAKSVAIERKQIIEGLFSQPIPFVNGFGEFINWLSDIGLKKGVATAMKKQLMLKVEQQLNLDRYFGSHIYSIEDVGNKSKPAPDVFLHTAAKLGVSPEQCVVIEDAPYGIEAALKAGMIALGLAGTFEAGLLSHAHFCGSGFPEIKKFLLDCGIR
jgi:beta-phosphoglucomutase